MAQNPTITPYSVTGVRDRVCQSALGKTYSRLTSDQQSTVDAVIAERFRFIYMVWKRIGEVSGESTDLPTDLQQLFVAEIIHALVREMRSPEQADRARTELTRLWRDTISYFTPDWTSSTSGAAATTFKAVDVYVTSATLRHEEGPFVVPSRHIDQLTTFTFRRIWNMRPWNFRRRQARFTINTDGQLTTTADFVFDQMGTMRFYYVDSPSVHLCWASPDDMAYYRARYDGDTGRPKYFTIQDEGDSKTWKVVPTPDQEYTVDGALCIATPELPATRTSASGFSQLPPEYHPILWDLVLGKILRDHGRTASGNILWNSAKKQLETLGPEYADMGRMDSDLSRPNASAGLIQQGDDIHWEVSG